MNTLFVEFNEEADLRKVKSMAVNMENEGSLNPKLVTFIPRILEARYKVMVERANIGKAKSPKYSSKIWVGKDFELRLRKKGDFTPWNRIQPEPQHDLLGEKNKVSNKEKSDNSSQKSRSDLEANPSEWKQAVRGRNRRVGSYSNSVFMLSSDNEIDNEIDNPNMIKITGTRKKIPLLGRPLLPISVITRNRFDPLPTNMQPSP